MKTLEAHPEVDGDIFSASHWYEQQKYGLGAEFADEVLRMYPIILQNPKRFPFRRKGVRWCRVERFSYIVIYVERRKTVWIVAVVHIRRHPDFWVKRLDDIP